METKLRVDSRSFDDKNYKVEYICSRTTGDARNHIRDRINDGELTTSEEVLKTLEAVHRDLYKAIKAKAEL